MPFAAAISEHPLATQAVGEVVGEVLDGVGEQPALAVLFVGVPHTGAFEDIAGAVRSLLSPGTLIGCTSATVVGGGREVEAQPAISLWAGSGFTARSFRLNPGRPADGHVPAGFPRSGLPADPTAALVVADPFTFPAEPFLDALHAEVGAFPVIGGMASAARGPGGNRLVVDDRLAADGGVGVVLAGVDVDATVSQGCRPIGEPMVVTRGERQVIYELAGRPALERLDHLLGSLPPAELALARHGLHLGRVIDEHRVDPVRGDFLVRRVLGGDREVGAIAVDDHLEIGATVQFQVRDADSADDDLRATLAGRRADGALLFTGDGRGSKLFGEDDHDAAVVHDSTRAPSAGMSCTGELGPVGGRSFLHGSAAAVALFRDR